jgi:hypothetical protein
MGSDASAQPGWLSSVMRENDPDATSGSHRWVTSVANRDSNPSSDRTVKTVADAAGADAANPFAIARTQVSAAALAAA